MEPVPAWAKHGTLTFWMIVLGLLAVWASALDILKHWAFLALGARVCDSLILASGVSLLSAGVWRLLNPGKMRALATVGAVAAGVFSATLLVGVWSGAIPCSGPS